MDALDTPSSCPPHPDSSDDDGAIFDVDDEQRPVGSADAHATAVAAGPVAALARRPASASVSSLLTTASDDRRSMNPAFEVATTLRSPVSTPSTTGEAFGGRASPDIVSRPHADSTGPPDAAASLDRMSCGRVAMDGALPEHDGMQALRRELQEIKRLAVSTEVKAQKMHALMMQDYFAHRGTIESSVCMSPGFGSLDQDADPIPPQLAAAAMPVDPKNPYNLRPGDLDTAFSPLPKNRSDPDGEWEDAVDDGIPDLGCMHYKRNVKVQCFDCQRWFPCRHCHDQALDLPFEHALNRKKTQNMLCMLCQTPQPAAEACMVCGQYAAYYYCDICKLWDNDSNKRIYHCDDCGICRVGEGLGKDFVHCRRCNVCISIATSASHPCIERATEGDCPLCLIALFESRTSVVSLPCGHYMHGDCYNDLMAVTYKCPVCSKSAVNMELQWRKLDDEIALQPMPDEDEDLQGVLPHVEGHSDEVTRSRPSSDTAHQRRPRAVWIGCNDCGGRSWAPFHWLGLKCQRCDSYNTNQLAPTVGNETEAERLIRQQQVHRQHDFTGNAVLRDAGIGVEDVEQRVDSALDSALEVPKSPSQGPFLSTSPNSAGSPHSPGRYFVRQEEARRPSFTGPGFSTSRFSAPSMPNIPTLSTFPDMPRMPRMPNLSNLPNMPNLPNLPNMPNLPNLPNMPNLDNMRQNLPNISNIEFPRFRPSDVMDAVTRSFSPMRYYLQGQDHRDDGVNVRVKSRPTSVQSDPTRRFGSKLRPTSSGSAAAVNVGPWDSDDEDDVAVSGEDSDSLHAVDNGVEEDSEDDEESGEDEEDDDDDDMVDGDEEMGLFGHR